LSPGEIHIWRVPAPRLRSVLHEVLHQLTGATPEIARAQNGKPFLTSAPHIKFNLSHSHGLGLLAVALDVEVGVDVELIRPLPDYRAIAGRFFPPSEAAALADEPDFFRRWTRIEAILKAQGVGLYGAGMELEPGWSAAEIDADPGYAAAAAWKTEGQFQIVYEDYRA